MFSQTTTPTPNEDSAKTSQKIQSVSEDECSKLLNKTLDAYEKAQTALKEKTAENQTNIELRQKEETYNAALLDAVKLLTSSEKRNKSFFEKLGKKLEKVLEAATDPKNLITIATLIVLVKSQ